MISKSTENQLVVLIVEDHLETRTFLTMLLEEDYIIDIAESAGEAIEKIQQRNYDIFLIDIALQDKMDGTELVQVLRNTPSAENKPMIAMSAHQLREDLHQYTEYGFDEFLGKPFFPEELLALIKKLIEDYADKDISPS